MDAVNYESIVAGVAAVGFTASVLATTPIPLAAFISVEDTGVAGMRFRIDGTDPTAAEGHLLHDEDSITVSGLGDLNRFRAIRVGAGVVTIRVTYMA